ncbi:hypothetical protein Gogos_021127 [Gossypium gossypioides]|uniref:RNase H type-1 domain-containing protein n=1 Tax=Gossypium gossypioides TaxID=34282 RepID=A0A7J9D738_GOSGO|nr:hypothetical protein [Gossypium gossypioides]
MLRGNSQKFKWEGLNFTMHLNEHIPFGFATEAIAYVQVVQLGLDLGLVKAEIEDNALSVIKNVQYGNTNKSGISAYVLSTKMLSSGYCLNIPREWQIKWRMH